MKKLPGRLAPPPAVRKKGPAMEDTLPRAGYPPVPEAGGKNGQAPDIMSEQVGALGPSARKI